MKSSAMTELQQVLLILSSISQQLVVGQTLIANILAKEAQGISQENRELLSRSWTDDMERLKLLGEAGRIIARIGHGADPTLTIGAASS